MKLFWVILSMICIRSVDAQDIAGNWQGSISAGGKNLRIVFHISKNANGFEAKFDSPDQNAYGLSAGNVSLVQDSIHIALPLLGGAYQGKWDGKNQLNGTLTQGPANMPLVLDRAENTQGPASAAAQTKPQTPQPPFPYLTEEVSYRNEKDNILLAGTLSKPSSGNRFPVVLLITGSGPQDRDESIGMHKPFAVIADQLTRAGIAVLRVDDRGVGKSTGDFRSATSENFASDVLSGIAYLKTRTDIDANKIGLLGHSEGAMIAPYVAARSADVAFLVLLAGPAVGGKETMYHQAVEKPLAQMGKVYRDAYGKLYTSMFALALDTAANQHSETYIRQSFLNWKKNTPDSVAQQLVRGTDEQVITSFIKGFSDFKRPWWNFFLRYEPHTDLEKIKIPVLALNGAKDEQVDPESNLSLLHRIFTKNGNPDFKTVEVPGVNHLFQHCKQCGSVSEYLALDETFDPQTLTLITTWIKQHTTP